MTGLLECCDKKMTLCTKITFTLLSVFKTIMRDSKLLTINFLLLLFSLLSFNALGQAKEDSLQSLSMHGDEYQNSCSPSQKSLLQNSLYKENIPNKSEAWELLDLLLCAPSTNKNVNKVLRSAKSKIKVEDEASGDPSPDFNFVNVNLQFIESLLAKGKAWNSNIVR